jgi:hypothetical protein
MANLEYWQRPSFDAFVAKIFPQCLRTELTQQFNERKDRCDALVKNQDGEDWAGADPIPTKEVGVGKLAEVVQEILKEKNIKKSKGDFSGSTLNSWLKEPGDFKAAAKYRELSFFEAVAPKSASLLQMKERHLFEWHGPAERFLQGLDAYASLLSETNNRWEDDEEIGRAFARRVMEGAFSAWGKHISGGRDLPLTPIGKSLPVSVLKYSELVDNSLGSWIPSDSISERARQSRGWLIDSENPEEQRAENSILMVLERAVGFRLAFPFPEDDLAPQFGLELMALTLSGKTVGMPFSAAPPIIPAYLSPLSEMEEVMGANELPRWAILTEICAEIMRPLSEGQPKFDLVEQLVRRSNLVRAGGDIRLVAQVLIEARQSLINWLAMYGIQPEAVDKLIFDAQDCKAKIGERMIESAERNQ